jgi:hypothetical protein
MIGKFIASHSGTISFRQRRNHFYGGGCYITVVSRSPPPLSQQYSTQNHYFKAAQQPVDSRGHRFLPSAHAGANIRRLNCRNCRLRRPPAVAVQTGDDLAYLMLIWRRSDLKKACSGWCCAPPLMLDVRVLRGERKRDYGVFSVGGKLHSKELIMPLFGHTMCNIFL